jgi:hypothetical protein
MNQEDIIRMGHEAGLCEANGEDDNSVYNFLYLERFAKLVAEAEREACAKDCEGLSGRSYEFDMGRLHCAAVIRARNHHD